MPAVPRQRSAQTPAERIALRRRAIFAECRTAGIDDDARRWLVESLTGCKSLADCTLAQLGTVLDHLKKRNGTARTQQANPWGFVFQAAPERQRYLKKIYRLAERVGAIMQPPAPVAPPHYVEGIVAQARGLRPHAPNARVSLALCDAQQLHLVVQILETFLKRNGA